MVNLTARSDDFHGTNPRPYFLQASFRIEDECWVVSKIDLSGATVMVLGLRLLEEELTRIGGRANRVLHLQNQMAWHTMPHIRGEPSLSRSMFIALF